MMGLREFLIAVFLLAGAFVVLVSMIGLVRLPDPFCRAHALGKGMTLGISLLLLSLWLSLGQDAGLKVLAAIFFQFLTIPVASHLLARLAYVKGYARHGIPEVDIDPIDRSRKDPPDSRSAKT
jgi:multicomponent Na+:H+ antiporter subunit G